MESHCREWHPEHIEWRDIEGNATIPKSVVFAEEKLGRRRLKAKFFIDRAERNRFFRYRLGFPYSLLRAGATSRSSQFLRRSASSLQEVHMGYSAPLIGTLVDRALSSLVPIDHLRRHMSEEGENMARLLTSGNGSQDRLRG